MAVAAGAISVVGGVAKSVIGARQAKKAREAIKNYKRQELKNAYEGLEVSTLSADLQREELARASATSIQALQAGGIRGVIGGVGGVQQSVVQQSRQIGADLDRQQMQIEQMKAADEVRIQQMQERREEADLAGLGQQQAVGQQNVMSGISTVAGAAGAMAGLQGQGGQTPAPTGATGAVGAANNPWVNLDQAFKVTNPVFTQPPALPYS